MRSARVAPVAAPRGRTVTPSTFATNGTTADPLAAWFVEGLGREFAANGYARHDAPGPDTQVVLHCVDPDAPKPYRRKAAPTFVIAIGAVPERPDHLLRAGYPLLVRALANLAVVVSDDPTGRRAEFVTLEQGTYTVQHAGSDRDFFREVFARLEPLASSRLVIANEFVTDLPEPLWSGDRYTEQIGRAGERLAALDLLPAAFPIEEILPPRDLRHVQLLFGIGGLSYGNVSARRGDASGPLGPEYWMSASGVDKGNLHDVGRDVLLVRGYDPELDAMVLSVPPDVKPRRGVGRRDRALDDLPRAPRGRCHPARARVDGRHQRHRHQLPVRNDRARGVGGRSRAQVTRPVARGRRSAKPRPHDHRTQPRRDLRAHRRSARPHRPDGLTQLQLRRVARNTGIRRSVFVWYSRYGG